MVFLKSVLVGTLSSAGFLLIILIIEGVRAYIYQKQTHSGGLTATAGTYSMVLNTPVVQILAVIVFAVSFYIVWRPK
jgi:uncharacterized membrane protein YiaA